jgi:hypothetical protein
MTPAIITFDYHIPGDTWQGVPTIGPIFMAVDGGEPLPMSAPIASARMHWRLGDAYPAAARHATTPADGESPIILVSAATWELSIPPVAPEFFPLSIGLWHGHLEITDTDGTVWTTHECLLPVGIDYTK